MARKYKRKSNGQFAGGGGTSMGSGTKAKMGTAVQRKAKSARRRLASQVVGGIVGANVGAAATLGNPVGIVAGAYGGAYGAGKVYDKRAAAKGGSKMKPGIKS